MSIELSDYFHRLIIKIIQVSTKQIIISETKAFVWNYFYHFILLAQKITTPFSTFISFFHTSYLHTFSLLVHKFFLVLKFIANLKLLSVYLSLHQKTFSLCPSRFFSQIVFFAQINSDLKSKVMFPVFTI